MSWFGFHVLGAAWLFLLTVPLVLFYFLKLKRQRQAVPSLFLWRQVLSDRRVNSPFQRFKRNILLLLQLLLLLMLVLAAMLPYWRGRESSVSRLPVLIDCSASMAALDRPGGISRLDAARKKVRALIDDMLPDQELCLISFSRMARRRTAFTSSKRDLRRALAAIQVEDVPSDVEDALRMAHALARSSAFEEVLFYSDGNFPTRADFELSFKLDYQRLEPAGPNIGITAVNATRSPSGVWNVYVHIESSPGSAAAASLEILQDGKSMLTRPLTIGGEKPEQIIFEAGGAAATTLEVRLVPDGFDSLASDNTAFLDLPAIRSLWVYASPSLASYRHALRAIRTVRLFPEEGSSATEDSYDLVITDNEADLALEANCTLTVGFVPAELQTLLAIDDKGTTVVDWRRNDPLLQHVELAELILLDRPRSAQDVRAADYENLGYDILAHGQRGPLLVARQRGQKLRYHLLFHSDRSTLPFRVGFPILITNLVQIAMQQAGLAKSQAARTGILPELSLRPDRTYRIRGPSGDTREEKSDKHGVLSGIPAPHVGRYRISGGGAELRVGASLLSPSETRLAAVEEIQFNEELSVAASSESLRRDRSLWWPLALVALFVMLGEWWYFQRRPGGYGR